MGGEDFFPPGKPPVQEGERAEGMVVNEIIVVRKTLPV